MRKERYEYSLHIAYVVRHVFGYILYDIGGNVKPVVVYLVFLILYLRRTPGRIDFVLSFLLYYTCFFSVLSMNFISSFRVRSFRPFLAAKVMQRYTLSVLSMNFISSFRVRSFRPFLAAKVMQRYTLFLFPSKFFSNFFSKNFRECHQSPIDLHLTKKFFFEGFYQLPANSRTYPYPFSSTYRV